MSFKKLKSWAKVNLSLQVIKRLPNNHHKIESLINAIATGKPYSWFGGQKIKCNNSLIRFRIGRNYRLLLIRSSDKYNFQLFNRQNYELNFKRNSSFSNELGGAKQWN